MTGLWKGEALCDRTLKGLPSCVPGQHSLTLYCNSAVTKSAGIEANSLFVSGSSVAETPRRGILPAEGDHTCRRDRLQGLVEAQ